MRGFVSFLVCVVSMTVSAKELDSKSESIKKFQPILRALTSTNNMTTLLKNPKLNISSEAQAELLKLINKKNKTFQIRKISPSVFSVRLSNGRWARVDITPGVEGIQLGRQVVSLNLKQSVTENVQKISQILKKEYPNKKVKGSAQFSIFPQAHAASDAMENVDSAIISTVVGAWDHLQGTDVWLDRMDDACSGKSLKPISQYKARDQEGTKAAFMRIQEGLKEKWAWGRFFAGNLHFQKFYRVQDCLRNHRFITDADVWESPHVPKVKNNTSN